MKSYSKVLAERDERGIALMELIISLPFIITLVCGVIDMGQALNEYLLLTEAVHEGVRSAGENPSLTQAGTFVGPNQSCAATSGGDTEYHEAIQKRVRRFISLQNNAIDTSALCVQSALAPAAGSQMNVTVTVSTNYEAVFPLFDGLPITVSANGPHLF